MLQVGVGLRCRDVSALGKYRILCPRLAGWVSGKATGTRIREGSRQRNQQRGRRRQVCSPGWLKWSGEETGWIIWTSP